MCVHEAEQHSLCLHIMLQLCSPESGRPAARHSAVCTWRCLGLSTAGLQGAYILMLFCHFWTCQMCDCRTRLWQWELQSWHTVLELPKFRPRCATSLRCQAMSRCHSCMTFGLQPDHGSSGHGIADEEFAATSADLLLWKWDNGSSIRSALTSATAGECGRTVGGPCCGGVSRSKPCTQAAVGSCTLVPKEASADWP